MVDSARVRTVLSRLTARRRALATYAELDVDRYLGDPQAAPASKYHLLTAIEDVLAVANHVIAAEAYRAPSDYADAFRSLAEAEVLTRELAARLEQMARFRNLLVHEYAEVDDRRVHAFLRRDLEDLDRFVAAVLAAFPALGADAP